MHDASFLSDTLIFLIAAVAVAPVFQRLRSGLVPGYLAAGVIIGPDALGLVSGSVTVQSVAELGVVFLLFIVGLELSVERLRVIRHQILGLGTAQVVVTAAAVAAIAAAFGFPMEVAVVAGAGLALSSTAVVLQLLSERGQLTSGRGRLAFAILLLQDLAVVPLLALVTALAPGGGEASVLWPLAKAIFALAAVALIGRLVLRPLLRMAAVGNNPELFAAVTLVVLLGTSWVTASVGLSLAIGGFLAGVLLAETEYRHQVAADIQPFRGLLLGLFFMTVGIGLDLQTVAEHALRVVALVAGLFALKGAIIFALCRCSGVPTGVSAGTALLLGGAGEFGFVIFTVAGGLDILERRDGTILAAAIAASMLLTPFAHALGNRLHARLDRRPADDGERLRSETADLANHVVIAGFGRVGESLTRALVVAEIPYVAIEFEPARVAEARARGHPVYYGDASRLEVLEAAGIARARAAVIIPDNAAAAERVVHLLRGRYPGLAIHARARDNAHMRRLTEAGASGIVHETYEMSLQLGEAVLRDYGTDEERIHRIIEDHRRRDYALLSDVVVAAEDGGDDPAN